MINIKCNNKLNISYEVENKFFFPFTILLQYFGINIWLFIKFIIFFLDKNYSENSTIFEQKYFLLYSNNEWTEHLLCVNIKSFMRIHEIVKSFQIKNSPISFLSYLLLYNLVSILQYWNITVKKCKMFCEKKYLY